jgi:hypothetical protein
LAERRTVNPEVIGSNPVAPAITQTKNKIMNIFVLDNNPQRAATMACDKHVVKMILETAQMMCTVVAAHDIHPPYRATHAKHPCTIWASESQANWQWLIDYGLSLSAEYTERYGKIHKSQGVIEWCRDQNINLPSCGLTPFAQAMPVQYRNECVVTAYRDYYMGEKERIATWKYSLCPDWWNPGMKNAGVAQR